MRSIFRLRTIMWISEKRINRCLEFQSEFSQANDQFVGKIRDLYFRDLEGKRTASRRKSQVDQRICTPILRRRTRIPNPNRLLLEYHCIPKERRPGLERKVYQRSQWNSGTKKSIQRHPFVNPRWYRAIVHWKRIRFYAGVLKNAWKSVQINNH